MISKFLITTILLSVAAQAQQVDLSNKVRYWKQGLTDAFHEQQLIVPTSHTIQSISDTSQCRADQCNTPSAVTAYVISYGNLGTQYACICDDAVFDINYMADNVGRVPYRVRNTVITYTAASIGKGGGAFTSAGKIVFFDQNENTEVFIHESAHAFDGYYGGLSSQSAYYAALNADSCVPDDYAATNDVEDFAQLMVTWVYMALTNSQFPACLTNSLNYMSSDSVLPKSDITSTLSTYPGYTTAPTSAPSTSAPVTSAPSTSAPATSAPTPTSCTIAVRQTFSNSWVSSGVTYTQYSASFINNGATDLSSSDLAVSLTGEQISQIWNLEQQKNGEYVLPNYQASIAAGNSYSFGYVVVGSSPLNVYFNLPSVCNSDSNPSTSAPSTSAPATSAPVTSAPATSAPVTSAPVTSAPVTSAPTTAPNSCVIEISQTLVNTWINNGVTYSQFNVAYTNDGTTASAPVVALSGGVIVNIWNVEQHSNGLWYLPSYQNTVSPSNSYTWGYIVQSTSALTIALQC